MDTHCRDMPIPRATRATGSPSSITRNTIPKRPKGDDLALPCIPEDLLPCYRVLSLPITPGGLHLCNNQTVTNVLAKYI